MEILLVLILAALLYLAFLVEKILDCSQHVLTALLEITDSHKRI